MTNGEHESDKVITTTTTKTETVEEVSPEEFSSSSDAAEDKDQMDETESFRDLSRKDRANIELPVVLSSSSSSAAAAATVTEPNEESSSENNSNHQKVKMNETSVKSEVENSEITIPNGLVDNNNLENKGDESGYSMINKKTKLNETVLSDVNSNRNVADPSLVKCIAAGGNGGNGGGVGAGGGVVGQEAKSGESIGNTPDLVKS